jgi:hypothetical protein
MTGGKRNPIPAIALAAFALPGGALYAAQAVLEAKAKKITVAIQNSGQRPAQR